MNTAKMIIGITHGDVNGVGYEVILKSLSDSRIYETFTPVIYGSTKALAFYQKHFDFLNVNIHIANSINDIVHNRINIINCTEADLKVEFGQSTPEAGKAALDALEWACKDLKSDKIQALVTAPINKKNIQSEHFHFPGHTEYLEKKFAGKNKAVMVLASEMMRVAVVTGHVPIKEVSQLLSTELILEKLTILDQALKQDYAIVKPRIAVLSLNPHAGDQGLLGTEEQEIIEPAIKAAIEQGIIAVGPYPADGFFGSDALGKFDAILAMYHDQGLIPFKALAMESGVNVTMGLSIVRTSPAHGTAYDIAGKNEASESSFREALYSAYDIYQKRLWHKDINKNPLKVNQNPSMERG